MKDIIEFKITGVRVNHDLDKYDDIDFFPEKTRRANERIAKWGLPKVWEEQILAEERKQALCVNGTLSHADLDTNTFLKTKNARIATKQRGHFKFLIFN